MEIAHADKNRIGARTLQTANVDLESSIPGKSSQTQHMAPMSVQESFEHSIRDAATYIAALDHALSRANSLAIAIAVAELRTALDYAGRAVSLAPASRQHEMEMQLGSVRGAAAPLLERAYKSPAPSTAADSGRPAEAESNDKKSLERGLAKAHLAHEVVDVEHEAAEDAETIEKARGLMRADSELEHTIKVLRRTMVGMRKALASPKVASKLLAAETSFAKLTAEYKELHQGIPHAHELLAEYRRVKDLPKQVARMRVGSSMLRLTKALEGSAIGETILKFGRGAANPKVGHWLSAIVVAVDSVNGYLDSYNQTRDGKLRDAFLTGAGSALIMSTPAVSIADGVVDLVAPEYSLGKLYKGTAHALTAIEESAKTGDTTAMEKFHDSSMKGEQGKPMQVASEVGDVTAQFWSEHGFSGGLAELVYALEYWR
jgi:hypothetical protein